MSITLRSFLLIAVSNVIALLFSYEISLGYLINYKYIKRGGEID